MEQWPSVSKIKLVHFILFVDTSAARYIKIHRDHRYASVGRGRSKGLRKKDILLCTKKKITIVIALWAESGVSTSEYSSFSKSTYRSSHLPASLKTLATSDKNITHPATTTCCGASQKSILHRIMSCSSEKATPYTRCVSCGKHITIVHATFRVFPLMAMSCIKTMWPFTL